MKIKALSTLLLVIPLTVISASAQQVDTVLSFQDAKARLMNYNLGLLSAYYEIDIARAQVIQARVWNNPYFIFNGDLWNTETNEYFAVRNQLLVQIEQTFSYAGKHTNSVKLARVGVEMSEKQLEDILRSLLFEVGNTYSNLAALQAKDMLYQQVISNYDKLMEATRKQLEVGAISQTEAIRLEAEYLDVKTVALTNHNEREQAMADLRTLLRFSQDTTFYVEQRLPVIGEQFDPKALTEQALVSRPDIQVAKLNQRWQEQNLKLQRSSGVPDIKFGFQPQDRGSNYLRPYHGFTTELSLPLFDRNQGRIKQAQFSIKQAALMEMDLENQVRNQVTAAYRRYMNSNAGLANYQTQFLDRLQEMNISTNSNFQKRNISLLQFIDQQRIYVATNIQLIELRQQFLNNVNELNFSIGTHIIEY
jgi:cobalt-zinc-cadmium efflux system outer membrane protein